MAPVSPILPWAQVQLSYELHPGSVTFLEWKIPQMRAFIERLAQHHTVVRYDSHGCGLSDHNRRVFSIAAEVAVLETGV